MKLSLVKREEGKTSFKISNVDYVFCNTLRRLVMDEVPTLAVHNVEIRENSTALYDEVLAHRLGLMPIKTDLSSYRLPVSDEEIEMKNASCTLQINLKCEKQGVVYAHMAKSADPSCTFVYPDTPIVSLHLKQHDKLVNKQELDVQKVDLTMTAVMGQGKNHVKWSPGILTYREELKLNAPKGVNSELLIEKCVDGVFIEKAGKLSVNQDKVQTSNLVDYYLSLDNTLNVESTGDMICDLELWGQLTDLEVLNSASDIMLNKIEEFGGLL